MLNLAQKVKIETRSEEPVWLVIHTGWYFLL
jgi:hypothetical protein